MRRPTAARAFLDYQLPMPHVSLADLIDRAIAGHTLVSFPTDTVPALAALPTAADLIYAAKQRQRSKPLILMGASRSDLWPYVAGTPQEREQWDALADAHWPGALTLVLPASPQLPPQVNPTDPTTIGVRVPASAIARQILAQTGPLATTSVNRSGEPPLRTLADINAQFPQVTTLSPTELDRLCQETSDLPEGSGLPSTVAKWTGSGWQVLRQGAIMLG